MKYKIELTANWRPKGQFYTPGPYRVPEDLSEDRAQEALKAGVAKKVMPAYETKAPVEKKTGGLTGEAEPFSLPPVVPAKPKRTYTRRKAGATSSPSTTSGK